MSTRNLLNIALLAIIAILAAIALLEPGQREEEKPTSLLDIAKNQINKMTISRSGEKQFILIKEDKWYIDSGFGLENQRYQADQWKIDQILSLVDTPVGTYIDNDANLAKYGLDNIRVNITLNDINIGYGNLNPLNQQRYLLVGNRIALVRDTVYDHLISSPETFISRRIFPSDIKFNAIQLPEFSLNKNEQNNWVSKDIAIQSQDEVHKLIDEWRHAQAISVQQRDIPKDAVKIALTDSLGKQHIFFGFDQSDGFFLGLADLGIAYQYSLTNKQRLLNLSANVNTP